MFERTAGPRCGRPRASSYEMYLRAALDEMAEGRFPRQDRLAQLVGGSRSTIGEYMPRLAANIAALAECGANVHREARAQRSRTEHPSLRRT